MRQSQVIQVSAIKGEDSDLEDEEEREEREKREKSESPKKPKNKTEEGTVKQESDEKPRKPQRMRMTKVESEAQCRALISEFYQMVVNRSNFITLMGRLNIEESREKAEAEANSQPQLCPNSLKILKNRSNSVGEITKIKKGEVINEEP